MTREETQKVLMTVQALFPNYNPPNKTIVVNVWFEMLSKYTYEQVLVALKAYALSETSGFAPSIGQLVDKLKMITEPQQLNEMEAWALVSKALRNGYYGAEVEFAKLPSIVQKAIGQPSQLRQWAQTNSESIENVVQSNFIKTYRAVANREKQVSKMPSEIISLIEGLNPRLQLENHSVVKIESENDYSENVPMPNNVKERIKQIFE